MGPQGPNSKSSCLKLEDTSGNARFCLLHIGLLDVSGTCFCAAIYLPIAFQAPPQGSYTGKLQSCGIAVSTKVQTRPDRDCPTSSMLSFVTVHMSLGSWQRFARGLSAVPGAGGTDEPFCTSQMKGRKHGSLGNVSFKGIPLAHSSPLAHEAAA